ncbi:MAG: hypothetical protein R2854_07465 [Caldilineaceae bacterium]
MWQKGGDVISEDRTTYTMNQEPSVGQVRKLRPGSTTWACTFPAWK